MIFKHWIVQTIKNKDKVAADMAVVYIQIFGSEDMSFSSISYVTLTQCVK